MVPRYVVSRAGGSACARGRSAEPRAVRDPPERDATRRVRPHLQLPGQSQGEDGQAYAEQPRVNSDNTSKGQDVIPSFISTTVNRLA